jgi:hypothetical protein
MVDGRIQVPKGAAEAGSCLVDLLKGAAGV